MANGNGITLQEAIDAARGSKGFVTQIAARLACSRRHVYNLMDKWVTFREAVEDERESLKDFAEGALLKKINSGDTASIIFFLKCQAKERGYVERQEITGKGGSDLTFRIIYDDDGGKLQDTPTEIS